MTSATVPTSALPAGSDVREMTAEIVRRLEQRSVTRPWNLLKTVLVAAPTFGLLPLLIWPVSFRRAVAQESTAFQGLAEWVRRRGRARSEVQPLIEAARETAPSAAPMVIAVLLSVLVVGLLAMQFVSSPFTLDRLLQLTYSSDEKIVRGAWRHSVHAQWIIALSIGYGAQWLAVRQHAASVRRFVERFNLLAVAEGLPAVRYKSRGHVAFVPMWVVAAFIFCLYGAYWSIPLLVAGIAQRRYLGRAGPVVRHEIAKRVRDIHARDPVGFGALNNGGHCSNPRCLAPVTGDARFCPRCGADRGESRNA